MNIARTSVLATIVALAAFLVACGIATPPASPQPEHAPTATPAPQAAFHIVRIPTEGRFSEPVKCQDHGGRASFSVEYLHATIPHDDWHGRRDSEPMEVRGRYGERVVVRHNTHDDTYELVGSRLYVYGLPSERVLVNSRKDHNYAKFACFVGQLTDARLPP
ncbi:MAG: hypothetical protein OXF79_14780 [Chloroflexi bacterium]|nr:hypothetical protein [Chloroflexota bacterium]